MCPLTCADIQETTKDGWYHRRLRLRTPSGRRGRHSGGRPCPPCLRPPVLSMIPTLAFSPLPTALQLVGASTQVPPGVETLLLRQHLFARRCILQRLRRLPAAAVLTLVFGHVVCRGGIHAITASHPSRIARTAVSSPCGTTQSASFP